MVEPTGILTLHLEVSRISDSLDDLFFSFTNIPHATGTLADQLVQGVMLDAAAAVENDNIRDVTEKSKTVIFAVVYFRFQIEHWF